VENSSIRRISIDGGGRHFPVVPHLPLLSSASQQWEGFLVERHLSDGFDVPKHSHSSILLCMQLNASLRLGWKLERGVQIVVLDAGSLTLHGAAGCYSATLEGAYNRVLFELDHKHLEHLTEGRVAGARVEIAERWSFKDSRLEHLLKTLYAELREGAPAGRLFGEQVGNAVAMLLAKQYSVIRPDVYGSGGQIPSFRLKKVFDYVEASLHQDIHLSDLASVAAMSPYYFARLFKKTTGICPHQYVIQFRIGRAKEMLRTSKMSIYQIGVCVGYGDPKHFRTLFRREVGISPSDYRTARG
jgi:AraC family transcriptional regulator